MGRKGLIWYPGAIYHITTRGNRKSNIFMKKLDYIIYLNILKEALEKYKGTLYCYCLMTNHVHLLIQTGEIIISQIMKKTNETYAKYFNNNYNLVGHLFQERYGWKIVQGEKYILDASKYIHLNPVKAKIVEKPEEYIWSSYAMYIGEKKEKLIYSNRILSFFTEKNCREEYKLWCQAPTEKCR